MKCPVIAIGLDSAEAAFIERWTAQGLLPNLARLKAEGVYGRTQGADLSFNEVAWSTFFTGCWPEKTGYWQHIKFNPEKYNISRGSYKYDRIPPFYELGHDYKIAAIDLPQVKLSDEVNGIQVLGWGAHSPYTKSVSQPADVLPQLKEQYGEHPAFDRDHARPWRKSSVNRLQKRCMEGVEMRRKIYRDLLQRDEWDLFLTAFSETHSAPHYTWHFSDKTDHTLYEDFKGTMGDGDPVLEVYQEVDKALGDVLEVAPEDARIVIFSEEGMEMNTLDLPSMAFLPEIMYRFSFPGRTGLTGDNGGANTPAPDRVLRPKNLGWVRSTWSTKTDSNPLRRFINRNLLMEVGRLSESVLGEADGPRNPGHVSPYFSPAMWFSHLWPQMRAFALPALGIGHIRINLKGRERDGIVSLDEYESTCEEIVQRLHEFRDPRTQKAMVTEVVRTRTRETALSNEGPQGDLVVKWDSSTHCDVIDSPVFGRVGPFAPRRTGGHNNHGFFIAKGPGIASGEEVQDAKWVDMAPMILEFMGAPVPDYMDGKSPVRLA